MVIRTLKGLGDAVYTYPVAEHFARQGPVKVITRYPIIFDALQIETSDNYSDKFDIHPRYTGNRSSPHNQFRDLLDSVGLSQIPFVFKWELGFTDEFRRDQLGDIITMMTNDRKRLCVIKEPCAAHMHKSTGNFSMAANKVDMQNWVDSHPEFCFVSVGHDENFKHRLQNIDFDVNNQTSVQDLLTLCAIADIVATQVGHLVPIAQGLRKPLKVFYPDSVTDHRMKHISPRKIEFV